MAGTQTNQRLFLFTAFGIIIFGFIILYSSSSMLAFENFGDGLYFIKRQIVAFLFGIVVAFAASKVPPEKYLKYTPIIFGLLLMLMILPYIPGLGHMSGGARRWIRLGSYSFQPGEYAKVLLVLLLASGFSRVKELKVGDFFQKLLLPLIPMILLVMQPDFGSFMVCTSVILVMLFLANFPVMYLIGAFLSTIPLAYFLVISKPYRMARVMSFLNPWDYQDKGGFQVIQGFVGMRAGGLLGVGLGNSQEKLQFLPSAHNDFVLAIIGEELGFIGIVGLLVAFMVLCFLGFTLAKGASTFYQKLCAVGLISLLSLQALLHFGVNLGLLPTKGLNLPFVSYGGSSLIASMFLIGVFLSMSKNHG